MKNKNNLGGNRNISEKTIVEVVGGSGGKTVVVYGDGTVWERSGSRGARNNNPGNLNYATWQKDFNGIGNDKTGEERNQFDIDGRTAVFKTREDGVRAYKHLVFERYGNRTIDSMIESYAPPSENNTAMYKREAKTGILGQYWGTKIKDLPAKEKETLLKNMFRIEDGNGKYTEVQIGTVKK